MRHPRGWQTLGFMVAALQLACGGSNPPVTVVGPAADIRSLTGNWFGDYWSPYTGRSGTITFELAAAIDSAWGRVVMTPRGAAGPLEAWRGTRFPQAYVSTELTIRFIRVAGSQVTGSLTPYADPATGEPLFTVFEGQVAGDTIAGTYTTRPVSGSDGPTGRWRVVRDRPAS